MSTQYSLTVTNNSELTGNFCVYQKAPNQSMYENLFSLAWFSKKCHPHTTVKFKWDLDYCFMWSECGRLTPGVIFEASERLAADPSSAAHNIIGFTKEYGAYKFAPAPVAGALGELRIVTDGTMPTGEAAVGIGMSGQAAFAVPATPNFSFSFIPHPEYWIAFGNFEEGDVIDINRVTRTAAPITFRPNVYSLSINLQEDNTWSSPVSLNQRNAMKLAQLQNK